MEEWRIADAKNKFSELVNNALAGKAQLVHRRDGDVVIISRADYEQLIGQKKTFKQYILSPPHEIDHLDDMRDKSPMRSIDL